MIALVTKPWLTGILVTGLACGGVGAWLTYHFSTPTSITTTVHDVKEVEVKVPILTERVVDHFITDPAQQRALSTLMKENRELKAKVTQVTSTVATLDTTGGTPSGGNITSEVPTGEVPVQVSRLRQSFQFVDNQLTADYDSKGTTFTYRLSQKFVLQTSTGTDPDGKPISLVKLYQETPEGLKPIPAETISVNSDPTATRWIISPRIQGGINLSPEGVKGGFVGLQLIKRGTSRDPKDIRWSVATVGVVFGDGSVYPVILPISFNLGSLPKQPFSNIWISPSVDKHGRFGVSFTATF